MNTPKISVGIPLFRSREFLDSIQENCRALAKLDSVEVIVSDRHGEDDTIECLKKTWRGDPRFRFYSSCDQLNWVEHMNFLLRQSCGDYFRWMPHDDLFPSGCLGPLVEVLDSHSEVMLAYGPTRAIDHYGTRMPERDLLSTDPLEASESWRFQHSVELFFNGACDGAFKGLFRREPIVRNGLYILPTRDLIHAERAWLFAVSLLGEIRGVEQSVYLKRFHSGSAHAQWKPRRRHTLSTTSVMSRYLMRYGPFSYARRTRGVCTLYKRAAASMWKQHVDSQGSRRTSGL